ncbi:hypothetical protein BD309DRAFT_991879 [Dichomitus squalens]|uniref:Uncharacterized protein n=1 Tax=Dichomitus squalens TaxID=114155 RepID=A0A4Q9PPC0_9APHY|nr:hypothetical protein BD309DRAFT_991879 [Dichomitus squalens]TBU56025.1 hypothetical protein BD310DRAFT_950432 [Dichomitus squalens]
MRDGLTLLVVGTVFASFLIPAAILLFFFTRPSSWGSPLVLLNICAIVLGLVQQSIFIYVIIKTTTIQAVPTGIVIVITAMEFLLPICVQAILLIRLAAVYRPRDLAPKLCLAIYIPVVAFKVARLVNAGITVQYLLSHMPNDAGVIVAAQIVWGTKYVKIEWFLQLFDDMYVKLSCIAGCAYADVLSRFVSGLFVYRLYSHIKDKSSAQDSWGDRFRTLFYIFVSNFIFPIIFNIAEIAVIFYDTNFLHGLVVVTVNCYVTILGVLLATIWGQGSARGTLPALAGAKEGHKSTAMTTLRFASRNAPNAGGQTSQDADDEFGFSEDESMPSMKMESSTRGSDSITQGSMGEEVQEKRLSASSTGRPTVRTRTTLRESVTAVNVQERTDPPTPVSVYASDPESFHTAADAMYDAV